MNTFLSANQREIFAECMLPNFPLSSVTNIMNLHQMSAKREKLNLCGEWKFLPDPLGEGEAKSFYKPSFDASSWQQADVPASLERTLPALAGYEGAAWYRKDVTVPLEWQSLRVIISLEGANYRSTVWINGVEVGRNDDGFLPFEFEVHELLKFGKINSLVVRVDNYRRPEDVPGLQCGWRPHGGVLRELALVACSRSYIQSFRVEANPHVEGGLFQAVIRLALEKADEADLQFRLSIADNANSKRAQFTAVASASVNIAGIVSGVKWWSPDHPHLYRATIELCDGEEIIDDCELRIGFRSIAAQGNQLLLNGAPIFLSGFNRHEDSPHTDSSPDPALTLQDLNHMKQIGCNVVRLCHYPHHPRTLDMCDELGLLVMAEIPLYWWNGCREGDDNFTLKKQAARCQLERMIERDFNHPSIVIWSVSNETAEELEEVVSGNSELVNLCKALDATRPATHVSNRWTKHTHFEEDDLICVNGYPTYNCAAGRKHGVDPLTFGHQWWHDKLRQLHACYPDKPILISEFGYPAFEGVTDGSLGATAQAEAIRSEYFAFDLPYVCGTIVWCYADHAWPEGMLINGVWTSPYGVMSRERCPKPALAVLEKLFRGINKQPAGGRT